MKFGLALSTLVLVACSGKDPTTPVEAPSAEPPPIEEVAQPQFIYYSLGRT